MAARRPGQFLEERIQRKAMIAGACIALVWALVLIGYSWWPAAFAVVPAVYVLDRQIRDGRRLDPSRELGGLEGERLAGEALASLEPEGVVAVHDLDVGRGNVDHVAITPQGVFAIEVKHLTGGRFHVRRGRGLMQGDRPADAHAAQTRRNAAAVHDLLVAAGIEVWVHPLLVSTKAAVWKDGFRIGPVDVVPLEGLREAVLAGPERLDEPQRQRILATLASGGADPARADPAG